MTRRQVASTAVREALMLRARQGIAATEAICPIDLALRLGLDVRFVDLPSLEGMYVAAEEATILVGAHRPPGRQAFSCAHELGHHVLRHGLRVDEFISDPRGPRHDQDEYAADCFAAFLLMPRPAVLAGLRLRGFDPANPSPEALYVAANWLGVGFGALVAHLRYSLRLLTADAAIALEHAHLPTIRHALAGAAVEADLVVADEHWIGRPIDLLTNQILAAPRGAQCECRCLEDAGTHLTQALWRPVRPGIDRLHDPASGWAAYVRVGRASFIGRAIYRHLEDPEYGDCETDNDRQ